MRAIEFLIDLRKRPTMYASNKEAFCAAVITALAMEDVRVDTPGHGNPEGNFYAKHIGHYGSSIVGCNDPFDIEWAHTVIDDAISYLINPR